MYKNLLHYIDNKLVVLKELKPLEGIDKERFEEYFRVKEIYSTNSIEGNTLTENETSQVVLHDLVVPGKSFTEHREAMNLNRALTYLSLCKERNISISETFIKSLHSIVSEHVIGDISAEGEYKTRGNRVSGSVLKTSPPNAVEKDIRELLAWYEESKHSLHPIELAVIFKYRFVSIHPFKDGNGKVSRLLLNYILSCANYPNVIINPKTNKQKYYDALEKDHALGQDFKCENTIQFICHCLIEVIDECIEILSED